MTIAAMTIPVTARSRIRRMTGTGSSRPCRSCLRCRSRCRYRNASGRASASRSSLPSLSSPWSRRHPGQGVPPSRPPWHRHRGEVQVVVVLDGRGDGPRCRLGPQPGVQLRAHQGRPLAEQLRVAGVAPGQQPDREGEGDGRDSEGDGEYQQDRGQPRQRVRWQEAPRRQGSRGRLAWSRTAEAARNVPLTARLPSCALPRHGTAPGSTGPGAREEAGGRGLRRGGTPGPSPCTGGTGARACPSQDPAAPAPQAAADRGNGHDQGPGGDERRTRK